VAQVPGALLQVQEECSSMDTETEQKFNALIQMVKQQERAIEQLAALQGLVYSLDLKMWVSKEKYEAFKADPR
jgi:hypothetical protein